MRCYNGCPDTALRDIMGDNKRMHRWLNKRGLWATWHNHTDMWVLSTSLPGPIQIIGPDFRTLHEVVQFVKENNVRKVA